MFTMSAEIIDGKELARKIRLDMKEEVSDLSTSGLIPHLTVILVGDNPASKSYVNGKKKASAEVRSEEHTSELQSRGHLVCRLLLEKKNKKNTRQSVGT